MRYRAALLAASGWLLWWHSSVIMMGYLGTAMHHCHYRVINANIEFDLDEVRDIISVIEPIVIYCGLHMLITQHN